MAVSVRVAKPHVAKEHADWRGVGWVATEKEGGRAFLVHRADHDAEKVKASVGVLVEDSDKVKTKDLLLLNRLDASFVDKASRVAVSSDGLYVAVVGVRKKTGGFLALCGVGGPRKPLVHQEQGGSHPAPAVLGSNKQERPRGIFVSQGGSTVVVVAHDFSILVWRAQVAGRDTWAGVWSRVRQGGEASVVPAAFDAAFVAASEHCFTSARLWPANVSGAPLQGYTEIAETGGDEDCLQGTRHTRVKARQVGAATRRMCLVVSHTTFSTAQASRAKAGQVGTVRGRTVEYATAVPEDIGTHTSRDIPCLRWDPEGTLLAVVLCLQQARLCFLVPGQAASHVVELPSEMSTCCDIAWIANGMAVACTDRRGSVAIVSRLGNVLSVYSNGACAFVALGLADGPGTVSSKPSPLETIVSVGNGATFHSIVVEAAYAQVRDTVRDGVLPRWIGDAPTAIRLLGSMKGLLEETTTAPLCSALTMCLTQKSEASSVKVAAKELVRVYRRCVVGLEWVSGVLGPGSLAMVASITRHLAMLLLHHLCERLLTRSTPPQEASLLLDAAFHAVKWTEGKLEDLTTQGFAGVTVHAGLQTPSWRYPEHWAMLGSKAQEVLESADDATRQPVAVLREVVLTRLRQCFVGRPRAADLAGLASLHRGHAAFLSDSTDGGAEHYAAAGRNDCLFAARLLSSASGAVAEAVELAVATLADATTWWGDTGLRHAPELLRRASSVDPSGRRPALCHALAGLTAGALYKARPRALPPVFADVEDLKLVATENSVREAGQRHMYRVLPERVVAACATKLRALTRTEEQNSLAGLNAELWLAYGWPLEALHAAMRAGLTETADRAMNLLNWQVNAQKNWDQWLDKAEPRPCSASPSTATTEADQLATYDRCRRSVEATMMSEDDSAKAFMEAASRASAARGGWVCQSCVSSLMAYFMLHALKQAAPVKAQHMLSMGVATDGLRQIAAAQLTAVARSLIAQLPPFDHTVSGVSEMPAPTAIMHQVFVSDGNVSDDLSRLMGAWSPQPPDSFFKQHDAISLVRNASKLLSWALICLCPSDTPSKCGASVLALLKTYRDHVMDDAPPAAPELDQFRKALRYAWLLTVWHTVHARQQSRRALLSVPPAWSAAQEEPREASLSGHGAEWVCKLTGWSQDVWETDAVQGGVLSALELCDDPVYVAAALGKSFYEESNRDSILTIAQSKRQQYYRLTRELSPEARQQLVKDQKAFFEQTLMHDATKEASRMVSADPYVAQLEGPGFNENANWLHELDQAFWSFANNLLDLDVMVGDEPRAKAAPRAGWAELVLLGRMLSSSTDGTLVLPYGKEESGERIPIKAAPNTGARAEVARSTERAKKGAPVRGAPPQSGSTPGGGRQAKEERQEGGRAAAAETLSVRKSTAGRHLPAVPSARSSSRPKQVDATLPYELQPISHGGLLLDAELTPSSSSLPSPVHPGNLRSILQPAIDADPSPPPVPVPLAASRPWAGGVASTPVNAALFRTSAAAAARDVPPSTTCTTKSTSAGTTYTHDSTSITSTQAPSTQTTTSVPEPVDVARVLSSPARVRKEKKERRREEKERRGDGRGKDRSGVTKPRTGAAAAAGDGHDNRGVGQVHYHYGESYRGAGNAAAAGGAGGDSRRHRGEGGADDAGAHGKRKPHVCSKHRARKDNPTRQRPRSSRPNRDLLLATNVAPLATDIVGAAMHRAHSAAATARAPYGPQVGLLRPQAAGPPPPPPPPEPVLLRPTTSPALAPKVSAPISNYFSLPRPRSDGAPTSAAAAMPAPPTPAEASLFVASQRGHTKTSPRSPPTQALDVCSVASIGLSPVQLPSPSPAKSATPHATPQRTPLGASPLASPGEVPPLPLPPAASPAASLLDAATSPHVRATPPGTPVIVGREPVPPVVVEVPVEPARAGLPRTAPNPEQPTLVGQPVLSATEELLYAKYIRQLGITSADAVITGGIPLVSYTPAVGYVPSDNLRELNDRHEALQSVDAKYASAASPGRPVQERPQAAASVPTPAPVPAPAPVQPAPVDVQTQARTENLEALLSSMMEKQAVAAASTGKEMAAAFSETLKNISPQLSDALASSSIEGRKMERDGMISFLQQEGTLMQKLARERLARPEDLSRPTAPATPRELRDEEYDKWAERQRSVAEQQQKKPATSEAAVDATEQPTSAVHVALSPLRPTDEAFLAVRELTHDTYEARDGRAELCAGEEAALAASPPEPTGRQFLNVQDTTIGTSELHSHKELDTRAWVVQAGVARFNKDLEATCRRADRVEVTMREAAASVQSCEAVLRDARRLKQQRETAACLDVLREDAARVEAKLAAEARPTPVDIDARYKKSAAPAAERFEEAVAVERVYSHVGSTSSRVSHATPHTFDGAQHSLLHRLQDMVDDGCSGRERFLWQNSTGAALTVSPPTERLPSVRRDHSSPAASVGRMHSSPLRAAPSPIKEVEVERPLLHAAGESVAPPPVAVRKEVEVGRHPSPARAGVPAAASRTTSGQRRGVSRTTSGGSSGRTKAPVPSRTPLSTVSAGDLNVYKRSVSVSTRKSTSSTLRTGAGSSRGTARQPSRRNADVPVSLQTQIDELDRMLQAA